MQLPKKFEAGDIVVLKKSYILSHFEGSIELNKGHLLRIEQVQYNSNRNVMFDDAIYVRLVLSTLVGSKPIYFSMGIDMALEILEISKSGKVLYGN